MAGCAQAAHPCSQLYHTACQQTKWLWKCLSRDLSIAGILALCIIIGYTLCSILIFVLHLNLLFQFQFAKAMQPVMFHEFTSEVNLRLEVVLSTGCVPLKYTI